jgi:hypothetical protein
MVSTLINAFEDLRTAEPNGSLKFRTSAKWPINTDKVRQALKEAGFSGKIVARCDVPNEYSAAIYRWAENLQGLPALVVCPETEDQISITVRFRLQYRWLCSRSYESLPDYTGQIRCREQVHYQCQMWRT